MANFKSGYILTTAGKALQAKVEASETTLKLTKMSLGDGTVSSIDDYADKTDLVSRKYDMIVSKIEAKTVGCTVLASVNSQAVDAGFDVTELGLFAQDGDDEILYCVSYDEDAMYVPGKSDGSAVECEFAVYIQFATAEKIEIVLPTDVSEIVKWVENNTVKCEEAAEKSEQAIQAADRAEQEAANATTAAATAESMKEDAVKASEAAATSESNAKASETAAKTSETNAKASATSASASATAAATSERNAKNAATSASASATNAATSETNAKVSETNAAASAKKAEEEATKLSKALKYKGSVATYSDLPTDPEVGDMWNIKTADKTRGIKAGDNVAWSGSEWDNMGGKVDLSDYALTADQQKDIISATGTANTITLIARDGTTIPLTISKVASATLADSATQATKATQDGSGNIITSTYVKKSDITAATTADVDNLFN